ncbi:thioredoxin-disulfide reductase [Candidatus Dependentiae bacterium]|nr:thioredoxin-disulfide reductase [Candidatus Dependentiae bacterium]
MDNQLHKLIIIGSGPASLTAAIYAARANLSPLVVEGKKPGGQLMGTSLVENWPGEKSIMGPELMMNMRGHAKSFGTQFIPGDVIKTDFSQSPFVLWTNRDKELRGEAIIIATGSSPNKLHVPGEDAYWGKGITTCTVCDGALYKDKSVIVVGGGDSGMEGASFLTKFTDKITLIQNFDQLTASHIMQQRVLNNPKIKIIYNSTIKEFKGNDQHVTEAIVTDLKTNEMTTMPTDGVFLAIGLIPNTKPFEGQIELEKNGYVKLIKNTQTSVPGVFAAGDVHDYLYKQAITSAGDGCKASLDAERYLANKR